MNTLKRKASEEPAHAQYPWLKQAKTHCDVDAVAQSMRNFDDADDDSDVYEPDRDEEGDEEMHDAAPAPEPRRKAMPVSQVEKQALLDRQVALVIQARDNCDPDESGERSKTFGPRTWPEVAKMYGEAFGCSVTHQAMEKRARTHRKAWLEAHPDYPKTIVYAEKPKGPRPARPREPRPQPQPQRKDPMARVNIGRHEDLDEDYPSVIDLPQPAYRPFRAGGWAPPDSVRNAADINAYIHTRTPVAPEEQYEWMAIEVEGYDGEPLGEVGIRVKDIRQSSRCVAAELESNSDVRLKLTCASKLAAIRYVHCVSEPHPTELPDWEFVELIDVYAVAAQMGDEGVKRMILGRWQEGLQQEAELEIDPRDLNDLFYSTELGDPAREFWAKVVFGSGLAGEVAGWDECHSTLKARLEGMLVEGTGVPPCDD